MTVRNATFEDLLTLGRMEYPYLYADALRVPRTTGTYTLRVVDGRVVSLCGPAFEQIAIGEFQRRYMAEAV